MKAKSSTTKAFNGWNGFSTPHPGNKLEAQLLAKSLKRQYTKNALANPNL